MNPAERFIASKFMPISSNASFLAAGLLVALAPRERDVKFMERVMEALR